MGIKNEKKKGNMWLNENIMIFFVLILILVFFLVIKFVMLFFGLFEEICNIE